VVGGDGGGSVGGRGGSACFLALAAVVLALLFHRRGDGGFSMLGFLLGLRLAC